MKLQSLDLEGRRMKRSSLPTLSNSATPWWDTQQCFYAFLFEIPILCNLQGLLLLFCFLGRVSLCRPGLKLARLDWPHGLELKSFTCLCYLTARIKGMSHHAWSRNQLLNTQKGKPCSQIKASTYRSNSTHHTLWWIPYIPQKKGEKSRMDWANAQASKSNCL